jgi:hypothetical protein
MPILPLASPGVVQTAPPRPSFEAVRIETPPVIDGRLDDEVWSLAHPIGEFTQVDPIEGGAPTEKTEVRILYDSTTLYVGIRCFDDDPKEIIGTQMGRDADLEADDRVEIVIDTFHDRRNAFWFQMNPVGAKVDALISNNGQDFNEPWNGIWVGKSSIDAQGWSVEMAIPFQTLSFDPSKTTWGFNAKRTIKRRLETDRWAAPRRNIDFYQIAEAGDLSGLAGMKQGIGLDVVPYFRANYVNDRENDPDSDVTGQPGVDVFYRLTPNMTAILTVNTDFAETEVDERQINLTRFPLFFPEKRAFFLENAGIYQFADLKQDLIPFFSRRIGLDDSGNEIPILWGGKLTGRAGDWNIGALDVQTDSFPRFDPTIGAQEEVSEQNLFAARVSKNIGEQSTVGAIVTHGDPLGQTDNTLVGLDANFRTSHFAGDRNLNASVFGMQTETDDSTAHGSAFGASISYPNDPWTALLSAKEIQQDFDPALGFVPRTGIRSYEGNLQWQPRINESIRWFEFGADTIVITDLDDRVQTVTSEIQPFGMVMDAGDELHFFLKPEYEKLDVPFDIQPDVEIPPGEYSWLRGRVQLESALKRPVSGLLAFEGGEFYDGQRQDAIGQVAWRQSKHFTCSLQYTQSHVVLPEGTFTTHLGEIRANVAFTPDIDWLNFVQFDNETETIGLNSRFRWIVRPGEDFYLVWNQVQARESGSLVPLLQEGAFKIVYTLRF